MFQCFSTILYVYFRNSREGKSTSGVGNPRASHPLNKFLLSANSNYHQYWLILGHGKCTLLICHDRYYLDSVTVIYILKYLRLQLGFCQHPFIIGQLSLNKSRVNSELQYVQLPFTPHLSTLELDFFVTTNNPASNHQLISQLSTCYTLSEGTCMNLRRRETLTRQVSQTLLHVHKIKSISIEHKIIIQVHVSAQFLR